jgi:hypothetical protein
MLAVEVEVDIEEHHQLHQEELLDLVVEEQVVEMVQVDHQVQPTEVVVVEQVVVDLHKMVVLAVLES